MACHRSRLVLAVTVYAAVCAGCSDGPKARVSTDDVIHSGNEEHIIVGEDTSASLRTIAIKEEDLRSKSLHVLSPDVQIGSEGADIQFGSVSAIIPGQDEQAYVVDRRNSLVRVFDDTGRQIRQFGGIGDGPGELRRPSKGVYARDTLYLFDEHGINRFERDGTYIDRYLLLNATLEGMPWPSILGHSSNGIVGVFVLHHDHNTRSPFRDTMTIVSLSKGLPSTKPLYFISNDQYRVGNMSIDKLGGTPRSIALATEHLFVTGRDGASIYGVPYTGGDGVKIALSFQREKVTRADVREILDRVDEIVRKTLGAGAVRQSRAQFERIPQEALRPIVGRILSSPGGSLVIERLDSRLAKSSPGVSTWIAIAPDGRVTAEFALGKGIDPRAWTGLQLFAVAKDSLDVESVVRYSIKSN